MHGSGNWLTHPPILSALYPAWIFSIAFHCHLHEATFTCYIYIASVFPPDYVPQGEKLCLLQALCLALSPIPKRGLQKESTDKHLLTFLNKCVNREICSTNKSGNSIFPPPAKSITFLPFHSKDRRCFPKNIWPRWTTAGTTLYSNPTRTEGNRKWKGEMVVGGFGQRTAQNLQGGDTAFSYLLINVRVFECGIQVPLTHRNLLVQPRLAELSPGRRWFGSCRPTMGVLNLWQHWRYTSERLLRAPGVCFHSRRVDDAHWDTASWVCARIFLCQNINPWWESLVNKKGYVCNRLWDRTGKQLCSPFLGLCEYFPYLWLVLNADNSAFLEE